MPFLMLTSAHSAPTSPGQVIQHPHLSAMSDKDEPNVYERSRVFVKALHV